MSCRGVNRLCCAHTVIRIWRLGALVVQILALHPFFRDKSDFRINSEIEEGDKLDDPSQRIGAKYVLGQTM